MFVIQVLNIPTQGAGAARQAPANQVPAAQAAAPPAAGQAAAAQARHLHQARKYELVSDDIPMCPPVSEGQVSNTPVNSQKLIISE